MAAAERKASQRPYRDERTLTVRASTLLLVFALSVGLGWVLASDTWRMSAVVFVLGVVVALVNPLAALVLLVVSFPAEVFRAGSALATYSRVVGAAVGLVLLPQAVASWTTRERGRLRVTLPSLSLAGVVIFSGISGLFADDRGLWLQGIWMLASRVALLVVVVSYARHRYSVERLMVAVAVAGTAAALVGLGQWHWGYQVADSRLFLSEADMQSVRASGVFESPVSLAFALMLGMACAAYTAIAGTKWARFASVCMLSVLAGGLLVTMTRSAVLGFIVFAGVLFILPGVLPRWSKLLLVAAALIAAIAAPASVKTRFGSARFLASERSIHNRPLMLVAGLRMALANPLGVGLMNFERHYNDYKLTTDMEVNRAAHNMYIEIAATAGLPAVASFLTWVGLIVSGLASMWGRARRSGERELARLSAFLLAIACGMLVQGLFHTSAFHEKFFWLFMGLGQARANCRPETAGVSPSPPGGGSA